MVQRVVKWCYGNRKSMILFQMTFSAFQVLIMSVIISLFKKGTLIIEICKGDVIFGNVDSIRGLNNSHFMYFQFKRTKIYSTNLKYCKRIKCIVN